MNATMSAVLDRILASPIGKAALAEEEATERAKRRDAETAIARITAESAKRATELFKEKANALAEVEAAQRIVETKRRKYQSLCSEYEGAASLADAIPHRNFLIESHRAELRAFIDRLDCETERLRGKNIYQAEFRTGWLGGTLREDTKTHDNRESIGQRLSAIVQAQRDAQELAQSRGEITDAIELLWNGLPGLEMAKVKA